MRRIIVRLSFIGRNLYGTQKQKDKETLQGIFEYVLTRLFQKNTKVLLCSRLDRMVNANDFVLAFDTDNEKESVDHLAYYLRRSLPLDIQIKYVKEVPASFHPRYDCLYKSYVYFLQNGEDYNPLYVPVSSIQIKGFDVSKFKEALSLLPGAHDFRELATPEGEENTIIDLKKAELIEEGNNIFVRFAAKSFLRYQVRFMVGLCLQYANGYLSQEDIKTLLEGKEVKYPRLKAEPQGLTLEKICYPSIGDDETIPEGMPSFLQSKN